MAAPIVWTPYCGVAPLPAELLSRWNFDPVLIVGLALGAGLYAFVGTRPPRRAATRFTAALALLLILFVSPFCALTSALFSARVVHHAVLVALVAPLIVAALPRPAPAGRRIGLAPATAVQALIFWFWHAPAAYAWALSSHGGYWIMQLSLLSSACAFWAAIRRAPAPAAVAGLLATMVQMGLLGALITFATRPLYVPHSVSTLAWGLPPLEDQQLAGLIMWAPAAGLYLAAALLLAARGIGPDARRAGAG